VVDAGCFVVGVVVGAVVVAVAAVVGCVVGRDCLVVTASDPTAAAVAPVATAFDPNVVVAVVVADVAWYTGVDWWCVLAEGSSNSCCCFRFRLSSLSYYYFAAVGVAVAAAGWEVAGQYCLADYLSGWETHGRNLPPSL